MASHLIHLLQLLHLLHQFRVRGRAPSDASVASDASVTLSHLVRLCLLEDRRGEGHQERVHRDADEDNQLEDVVPDTNVVRWLVEAATLLVEHLPRVRTQIDPVDDRLPKAGA